MPKPYFTYAGNLLAWLNDPVKEQVEEILKDNDIIRSVDSETQDQILTAYQDKRVEILRDFFNKKVPEEISEESLKQFEDTREGCYRIAQLWIDIGLALCEVVHKRSIEIFSKKEAEGLGYDPTNPPNLLEIAELLSKDNE